MPVHPGQHNRRRPVLRPAPFRARLLVLAPLLLLGGCLSAPQRPSPSLPAAATRPDPQVLVRDERPVPQPPVVAPAQPPRDLWERLRRGFVLEHPPREPRLARALHRIAANPAGLERLARRARPFLHYIVEQVAARGMPLEVALLPAVESGFRPCARSSYRAAGLWQFMPATGDAFGLTRNRWYDGRCDVTAATRAALDYLEHLAGLFDRDWELALAAYNAGPGTVQQALRRNRAQGRPADYWSLQLPRETSQYVPKLLALAEAIRDPAALGAELEPIPDRPQFSRVAVAHRIELHRAARLAGLDGEVLTHLNSALKRGITAPEGPHDLLLPSERAPHLRQALARMDDGDWAPTWREHRIRNGETLGGIARRYGVGVAELRLANGLGGSLIRAGRTLRIPYDGADPAADAAPPAEPIAGYRVRSGDNLWDIARKYGVDHRRLAAWNGLGINATLRPGTLLQLSPGGGTRASFSYRVERGDSLYRIAHRFRVSIAQLRRWNPQVGTLLRPGDELTLHLGEADTASL